MHFIGSALTERASPSPDRLGGIDLRPADAEGVGGGFGFGFGAEHAEDRRAAAGHEGGDGSVLPEGGLDGLVVLSPAALLEGVSGSGADSVQVARPDGGFLSGAVGVDAAANFVVGRESLRRRDAVAGHHHREPALGQGRQCLDKVAEALHPAGAAHEGKRLPPAIPARTGTLL